MAGSSCENVPCETIPCETVEPRPRARLLPVPIKGAKRTIVILSLALASCQGSVTPIKPSTEVVALRFLADSTTSPLLRDLANAYHPPRLLITWDLQVGTGRTVLDWLKTAEAPYAMLDYVPARFDSSLWTTPVAQDGIAIVVHPLNPIANLTAAQLRAILQGQITNWQTLGGANLALTVVVSDEGSSASAIVQSIVLDDRRMTRAARLATTDQAVIEIVGSDPGAIGYVSMGYLDNHVKAVSLEGIALTPDSVTTHQYPIAAPIVFAGLKEPASGAYRDFFAWVQSPEGQTIVRQHYGALP
ncbi:MAG: substrate-binding domain-containing protein [Chloroflexota bacterium]